LFPVASALISTIPGSPASWQPRGSLQQERRQVVFSTFIIPY
jgi:hypothetical protein